MVGWGWPVCWRWGGLVLWVLGDPLVLDISHIARVAIGHVVGDDLGASVGKGHSVLANSVVAVPLLVLGKVGSRVGVCHCVLVAVDGWRHRGGSGGVTVGGRGGGG